jgi:deoxyribonuclease-4
MRRLGVHTSIAGGLYLSLGRAKALGCNTVQIFSHNPRGWSVKPIPEEDALKFKSFRVHLKISPVYIHTSYLINMASRDNKLRRKSIEMLVVEMDRADAISADYVILHAGSASGEGKDISIKRVVNALNEVANEKQWEAGLLIENTAGERGDISSTIQDLSEIITRVKGSLISGVCIDTCHAFSAGYDIRNYKGIRRIAGEIKRYIKKDMVKLIHLNDSKGDIGSGLDRHEHIGLGKIGLTGLKKFIQYPLFKDIPLILETPKKTESDDEKNLMQINKMLN